MLLIGSAYKLSNIANQSATKFGKGSAQVFFRSPNMGQGFVQGFLRTKTMAKKIMSMKKTQKCGIYHDIS